MFNTPNGPSRTSLLLTLALFVGVALALNALFGLGSRSFYDLLVFRLTAF